MNPANPSGNPLGMMGMSGRSVLVTGASSGIGRETAIFLSRLGARVILAGRNAPRLLEAAEQLEGAGHATEVFDAAQTDLLPAWLKEIAAREGPLDGLVHSAGIHQAIPLRVISSARAEEVLRTNVVSSMMLVKGFRQKGCASEGGSIVLLASAAGLVGEAGVSSYSASKAALIGFTRSAAMELAPERLRVNCVAPGLVNSGMGANLREKMTEEQFLAVERKHPLGLGTPADVAYAIAFLLAPAARWITGTTLVVDGGYTAH